MKLSLQNQCVIILIALGFLITIAFLNTFWSLLGFMLIGGGIILFFIYYEQRWIKREYLKRGLIATTLFAIIYGILEYIFFDATWNNWFKISDWFPDKYYYWAFMTILNFLIVFAISRKSIALSLSSIPLFAVNEDLWYWITKSIHEARWVFPVGNWFDARFPFLQGLGDPIYQFPYWPRFYFVGWILISILLIIQFRNAQGFKLLIGVGFFLFASLLCILFVAF
jgi:hypothetical protein